MKPVGLYMKSRTRWARVLGLCAVFAFGGVCHYYFNFEQTFRNSHPAGDIPRLKVVDGNLYGKILSHHSARHLLQTNDSMDPTTDQGMQTIADSTNNMTNATSNNGIYPPDIFTLEQKKNGAIILHVLGMIYMFVALAIVCDEFFVPALSVITDKLDLSDDVAGATFMAAGGSAPELFTSLIGVFFARSDVGVGTIVGSAVFNILFVIGMCATFSKGVLSLTWWPLFRDCLFYSISLAVLLYSFSDTFIRWYESLCLLIIYILYVVFMKYNMHIERFVKSRLLRKKVSAIKEIPPIPEEIIKNDRRVSLPHFRNNASMFRHGALQLMLHTLDPLSDSDVVEDKAMQLQVIAKTQHSPTGNQPTGNGKDSSQQPNEQSASRPESARSNQKLTISYHNGYTNGDIIVDEPTQITTVSQTCDSPLSLKTGNGIVLPPIAPTNGRHPNKIDANQLTNNPAYLQNDNEQMDHAKGNGNGNGLCETTIKVNGASNGSADLNVGPIANGVDQQFEKSTEQLTGANAINNPESPGSAEQPGIADMEVEEPLDISWPQGWKKRVTYILLAPLVYLLYFTLPDVRRMESRRWYPVTFVGSILWIAVFSYLMVWWAKEVGDTIGIEERVMGLTFLAAGTSIPDLITSVIVARKGLGDMAVSSSVGSNIFDITVGLPLPWILWSITMGGGSVSVDSRGLFCSIFLLFGMLVLVVILIAANKWKMTKVMGGCMFLFYVAFLVISLLLLFNTIPCVIGV